MANFKFFSGKTQSTMDLVDMLSREIQTIARTPEPVPEELFMEQQDINTGEFFGIPVAMCYEISYKARVLFFEGRTVSGRCGYYPYEYWIDNIYRTITTEDRLVVDVVISKPLDNGRNTHHRIRQRIPYE